MNTFPYLLLPASAGGGFSICQAVFCGLGFISAGAFAPPVNGSFAVSPLCRLDRCEPAECLTREISIWRTGCPLSEASAAFDPAIFQCLLLCDRLFAAVASAQPHGSCILRRHLLNCDQHPEALSGDVLRRLATRSLPHCDASTALNRAAQKLLAARVDGFAAVASASSDDVAVVPIIGWF